MVSRNLGFRFSLVSYNILSQTLLHDHGYLYTSCNPKDLEWPRRGHRILSALIRKHADIICLQEVENEHLQSLYQPKLARYGYQCLYKKKTGYKIDGCAIFFKSKLFHLLDHKGIEFNRTDMTNLLNRDNVGIIAVLKPKSSYESESRLVIANTHLIFNPKRCDIKLAQLKLFLSELEEISLGQHDTVENERCHYPTILCGDLNSVPESDVNRFIIKNPTTLNESEDEEKCEHPEPQAIKGNPDDGSNSEEQKYDEKDDCLSNLSHTFQFKSVYPVRNRAGESYVSTSYGQIVDYIFYTPNIKLDSYTELLTEEQLREIGPLPNSEFPSDHLTLEAEFRLRSGNKMK